MINNHLQQFAEEIKDHWQHALAAAAMIRSALPMQEWIKIGTVAIVTAVVTSQVTLARLDERINRLQSEREILVKKRDEQVSDIRRQVERLEVAIHEIHREVSKIRAEHK